MASPSALAVEVKPEGYAIITMHKEPVNSMDLALWTQLEQALDSLEANPAVKGLILASGLKRDVFTAGNDLMELFAPKTSAEKYERFWVTSNRFLVKLCRSRLATVAAIRGACPAGGCIISLCCDHRLMTPEGTIGLNEVLLGIPVPKFWGLLMSKLIGHRAAEGLLLNGRLISPQEAKKLGMVDEIVDKEQLLPAAELLLSKVVKLPSSARAATKTSLREDFCKEWEAYYVEEHKGGWKFLNQQDTLKVLGATLQRLSGKGAPSKL